MSLISTYDLRLWMGIEEGDKKPNVKLSSIAQAVEDFVDSYTNRKLEAQVYTTDPYFSYIDGKGRNYIYLPQYPVSSVASIYVDNDRVFGSGTLVASSDYFFYPTGKVRLNNSVWSFGGPGGFQGGFRNILANYTAGYAPVVGGTWNSAVSTYPVPQDLKQTMIEMCVESFKEGMTAVHTVQAGAEGEPKFIQMLSKNSFWRNVLVKYKNFASGLESRDE